MQKTTIIFLISTKLLFLNVMLFSPARLFGDQFEVRRCGTSKFARYFLSAKARMYMHIPIYVVFDSDRLNGFAGVVNHSLFPNSFYWSGEGG